MINTSWHYENLAPTSQCTYNLFSMKHWQHANYCRMTIPILARNINWWNYFSRKTFPPTKLMFKTQNIFISIVLNTSFAKCYEIVNVFSFVYLSGLNFVCCFCLVGLLGPIFLRCTKILSHRHSFVFFLPSSFLPCKNTFMDDYDGI
jgi:hypothetical protein